MHRRDFLRSTGGLAAVAASGAAASLPAEAASTVASPRALTFATPWQEHHAGYAGDAHRLARRIEAALDGTVRLSDRPLSATRGDIGFFPVQSDVALHPAFAYFGGLPGEDALSAADLQTWLMVGGGQDLWDDLARPFGFKPLLAGHTGSTPVLWSKVPIRLPADLAGLVLVARGLDAEVARALGASPVVTAEQDLESLLQSAETEAAIWGSVVQSSALSIPKHFPFGISGAFGPSGGTIGLKIDLALWDGLSASEQAAITAIAREEFQLAVADADLTRSAVAHAVNTTFKCQLELPAPAFTAAVSRIAAAIVAHTAAHDTASRQIDRSYTSFRRSRQRSSFTLS